MPICENPECTCCFHRKQKKVINPESETRECSKCGMTKSKIEFRKNRFECLECHRTKIREKYHQNEEFRKKRIISSTIYNKMKREIRNENIASPVSQLII
jgi:hypothetical protein